MTIDPDQFVFHVPPPSRPWSVVEELEALKLRIAALERNEKPLPPGKRFYCEETTIDVKHGHLLVRVWLDNDHALTDRHYLFNCVRHVLRTASYDPVELAVQLTNSLAPRVTTVQVLETFEDGSRLGHMVYPVPL